MKNDHFFNVLINKEQEINQELINNNNQKDRIAVSTFNRRKSSALKRLELIQELKNVYCPHWRHFDL